MSNRTFETILLCALSLLMSSCKKSIPASTSTMKPKSVVPVRTLFPHHFISGQTDAYNISPTHLPWQARRSLPRKTKRKGFPHLSSRKQQANPIFFLTFVSRQTHWAIWTQPFIVLSCAVCGVHKESSLCLLMSKAHSGQGLSLPLSSCNKMQTHDWFRTQESQR